MLNERKIDSFFNKKKRSTRGVLEKPEKSYSNFESTCGSKQTLTKLKIEKKLLEFDFNPRYGPSYGITRIERFQRAQKLGLNPNLEIIEMINLSSNDSLWSRHFC